MTEVTASCRLQVRLVTRDMLYNAVTIRLDRMTQSAFLSQVLSFFLDALAQIFSVPDPPEQNIFLIDVEEDTDVSPEDQILNVSVAIRKGSFLERGRTRDVFYAPEYLREVIYLHRALLANLSTLQVSWGGEMLFRGRFNFDYFMYLLVGSVSNLVVFFFCLFCFCFCFCLFFLFFVVFLFFAYLLNSLNDSLIIHTCTQIVRLA